MGTLRFLLRRLAAQRMLGLAAVVTLSFSIGVLVAGPIYAEAARGEIWSSALAGASVTVTNARYEVEGSPRFPWSDVDAAVTEKVSGLPVRRLVPQGLSTVQLGIDGPSLPMVFRDGSQDHLSIHGDPPGPGEVLVSAGGVGGLSGIGIGDTIEVVGPAGDVQRLRVSGTYDPPDPDDPYWFGPLSPFPPYDPSNISKDPSPLVVGRQTYLDTAATVRLRSEFVWDAFLDLTHLPYGQIITVPAEIRAAGDTLRTEPGLGTLRASSGLSTLIQLQRQRTDQLNIPILLVVFQIAAVTLAVLAGVGALTLTRQSFELAVLHSRGVSTSKLLWAQAAQAGLTSALAYPVGLAIGVGITILAGYANGPRSPGVVFPVGINAAAALLGLIAAVAGAMILILLSIPLARRTVLEERRNVSREDRPLLARLPVELIVLPLGIVAFLRLRQQSQGAGAALGPLVLAAPTLLLFGLSFLSLRIMVWWGRRLDRRIGRMRRLPMYLSGRRLARSPGNGFATALLLLVATGLLVLATSYRDIVLTNHAEAALAQVGAAWNVAVSPPDGGLGAIERLPHAMTPVVRTGFSATSGSFSLPPTAFGIDPATFGQVAWWRSDYSPTPLSSILDRLATAPYGLAMTEAPSILELGLDMPPGTSGLTVTATVADADGKVTTATPVPVAPVVRLSLDGAGDRLLSITFQRAVGVVLPSRIPIRITRCDADGATVDLGGWIPISWRGSQGQAQSDGKGIRYTFSPGVGEVVGGVQAPAEPLPALVSGTVQDQLGTDFTIELAGGQTLPIHTIATASQFPAVPPGSAFIVMPGTALLQRLQAVPEKTGIGVSEVWADGPTNPSAELRRLGLVPDTVHSTTPIEEYLSQQPLSLAVGLNFAASLAGISLIVIGVAAGLYFAQRRRFFEFAALRAIGTGSTQIRRTLIVEQGVVLGFAIVAGLALGYLLLRLVMPSISQGFGVPFPAPRLVLDWKVMGIALVTIIGATMIALGFAVFSLMGSSVTAVQRGEVE
jgi:putative ABC transport system permease protein